MRLFLSNHPGCIGINALMESDDGLTTSEYYECLLPGENLCGISYDDLRALGEEEQPVDIDFSDPGDEA